MGQSTRVIEIPDGPWLSGEDMATLLASLDRSRAEATVGLTIPSAEALASLTARQHEPGPLPDAAAEREATATADHLCLASRTPRAVQADEDAEAAMKAAEAAYVSLD